MKHGIVLYFIIIVSDFKLQIFPKKYIKVYAIKITKHGIIKFVKRLYYLFKI